jgi:AcrR family transcriptional regulator
MQSTPDYGVEARTRILNATKNALAERSAQFFKVRDIAKTAGVSPALVLRYFKSKDELVFEAIISEMNDTGKPKIDAWLSANPQACPEDFSTVMLRTDLQNGHSTRDLMSMQWWWSSLEEQAFQDAIKPRAEKYWALMLRHYGLPAESEDSELRTICQLFMVAYLECLRRAGVQRQAPETAIAELMALCAPLRQAFARRAAQLLARPTLG